MIDIKVIFLVAVLMVSGMVEEAHSMATAACQGVANTVTGAKF